MAAKKCSHRRQAQAQTAVPSSDAGSAGCTCCATKECGPTVVDSARSLIEITTSSLSGLSEEIEEFEEIEFLVDSGAGTTVIGPEHAKAVQASDPDPDANYKLADDSIIPNEGRKQFAAMTEDWNLRSIKAAVSVSSCVLAGATVVFSPSGSYIDAPGCNRVPLTANKRRISPQDVGT